jgi:hypothetical protein
MIDRLGLWCLMPLSTIFQLYHGGQFYWWSKPEKTKARHDVTDIMLKVLLKTITLTLIFFFDYCNMSQLVIISLCKPLYRDHLS